MTSDDSTSLNDPLLSPLSLSVTAEETSNVENQETVPLSQRILKASVTAGQILLDDGSSHRDNQATTVNIEKKTSSSLNTTTTHDETIDNHRISMALEDGISRAIPEIVTSETTSRCVITLYKILVVAFVAIMGIFLGEEIEVNENDSKNNQNDDTITPPPGITRTTLIEECATTLSQSDGTFLSNATSPQFSAVEWFLFGNGLDVAPPPSLADCAWETDFGQLYALLVLREALSITDETWGYGTTPVATVADVCRGWSRVECSEDKTRVTKLHLGNETGLKGTIPSEMAGLSYLERFEIYSNERLMGEIPSAMGRLTSLEFLYLHHTGLGSTIPSSLGSLVALKELFVSDTILHGSMPDGICQLRHQGALEIIHADCGGDEPKLVCSFPDCCTNCYV